MPSTTMYLTIPKQLKPLIGRRATWPPTIRGRHRVNGLTTVRAVRIAHPFSGEWVQTDLDADTGAWLTFIYQDIIRDLALPAGRVVTGIEARGGEAEIQVYHALLTVGGQRIPVEVGATTSKIGLLGYWALQSFGLAVDTVTEKVVPARLLL